MEEEIKEEVLEEKENKKEKKKRNNKEIEELQNMISSLKEEVLLSKAELINYRKRKDEETSKILKYANEDLILKLLLVIDNFDRALSMNKDLTEEQTKFLEGFSLINRQLKEILDSFEVKEIEALDKEFDPNIHHAITTACDETKESGIILNVAQKGYTYKDRVIRPSMVVVNERER